MDVPLSPLRFKGRALSLYGSKSAIVCGDLRFTYAEFFGRCDRLSRLLGSLGIGRGDRVAFLAFNCHRLLEAYYGVVQAGAVLLPMNVRLAGSEFEFILNDSGSRVLFFDPELKDAIAAIRPRLETVEHYVPLQPSGRDHWTTSKSYDELLAESEEAPYNFSVPDEDEVAELFYTSGTTGNPKGVMLTHRNLYLHALATIIAMATRDSDVHLHTIPLFHVNGWGAPQTVTCMGGTHVMLRKFDPGQVFRLITRESVSCMSLVPTMATALLNHPDVGNGTFPSMRLITLGGAAPSQLMVEKVERAFGCACMTGYGLSETSPVLSLASPKDGFKALTTSERWSRQAMTGIPLVGVEIRVVDENDQDVPSDGKAIGEVIVRSDHVMKGYWRQPGDTAHALRNGWFHTGDMATLDEEGYLLIVDRKKDIIISGGENIASVEIEKCLAQHPAILECAVIPVPDPQWGEVPKALVVLQSDMRASEDEILAYCRKTLAGFKCPGSVDFMETLPKGGTGKILKRTLRERYWTSQSRRVQG